MVKNSRQRVSRIAVLVVGISAIAAATIYRPTWPQDLWLKATTRTVPFEFASLGACDERDAYQPDEMSLSKDKRSIQVFVSLNCADKPGQPSASQRSNTLFLRTKSVPIDPNSGLSAACYCSNKVTFTLKEPIQSGQNVVFISDSFEGSRLIAP